MLSNWELFYQGVEIAEHNGKFEVWEGERCTGRFETEQEARKYASKRVEGKG